jgi:hypothetical protein
MLIGTSCRYVLYLLYRTVMCLADLHVSVTKVLLDPEVDGCVHWSWPHVRVVFGIRPK